MEARQDFADAVDVEHPRHRLRRADDLVPRRTLHRDEADDHLRGFRGAAARRILVQAADAQISAPVGARGADRAGLAAPVAQLGTVRSEEHTSELQSLMRISYAR